MSFIFSLFSRKQAEDPVIQNKRASDWIRELKTGQQHDTTVIPLFVDAGPSVVPQVLKALGKHRRARKGGEILFHFHLLAVLGRMKDVSTVPAVSDVLSTWSFDLSMQAVETLGEIGSPQAVPPLLMLLRKLVADSIKNPRSDMQVLDYMGKAFAKLGEPAVEKVIVEFQALKSITLDREANEYADNLTWLLRKIGAVTEPYLSKAISQEQDPFIRDKLSFAFSVLKKDRS